MSTIKALGVPKIKALGLENIDGTTEEVFEVKSIKLITSLEKGSANDGKGINTQLGMLHGKNYTFEVTEYIGKTPKNKSEIKWELFYNDPDIGLSETAINGTGERITINMGQVDSCGCFLYFRAYIKDKKNSAVFKVWKHNRFRWFDRLLVEREIEDRILNPWKINQSNTSLCGMACLFYLFAKEQPKKYRKFCLDLFRKGEAKINNYTAKPTDVILDKNVFIIKDKITGKNMIYPQGNTYLSLVDFITLAGVRNSESSWYKGGDEDVAAINWTNVMVNLCEKLLGYNEVESKGASNFIKPIFGYDERDITLKIKDINKQVKDGYRLIWMVDSDLINDEWDYKSVDLHWIVLESEVNGELQYLNGNGEIEYMVDFKAYSYGKNPFDRRDKVVNNIGVEIDNPNKGYLKKPITRTHFMNNFNGYIKVKNL